MRRIGSAAMVLIATAFVAAALRVATDGPAVRAEASTIPARKSVAIVDLRFVFQNSDYFKQAMERVKEKEKAKQQANESKDKRLATLSERLSSLPEGSVERQPIEDEIAVLQLQHTSPYAGADFRKARSEAYVYECTYHSALAAVESCCKENHIELVIRVSDEPAMSREKNDVLRGVPRRNIVWTSHDVRDISREVVTRMNKNISKDDLP
jgi:Skp family chaperone for outer membrane proteins